MLYQVVKDHPFLDGNKRSGAALFIYFLSHNETLRLKSDAHNATANDAVAGIDGNTLTAMTLMIALSRPEEKDTMTALIKNFLA